MIPVDRDGKPRVFEHDGKVYPARPLPVLKEPAAAPVEAPQAPAEADGLPPHAEEPAPYGRCDWCHKPLPPPKTKAGRRKRYCGKSCRAKARYARKKAKEKGKKK